VPFQLTTYKDVGPLYEEAMNFGFNIDKTLPSEIASSALFTSDLPRVCTSPLLSVTDLGACQLFQD